MGGCPQCLVGRWAVGWAVGGTWAAVAVGCRAAGAVAWGQEVLEARGQVLFAAAVMSGVGVALVLGGLWWPADAALPEGERRRGVCCCCGVGQQNAVAAVGLLLLALKEAPDLPHNEGLSEFHGINSAVQPTTC